MSMKCLPPYFHLYTVKLRYTGVYIFLLFFNLNIDCGYSLEPPRRGGSNVYPQSMFELKVKKVSWNVRQVGKFESEIFLDHFKLFLSPI